MIRIRDLGFRYSDATKPALRDVNLEIEDGEFVLVTGPSGGGKSSLCRCLNGLIPHFYGGVITGRVEVQGLDVMKHSPKELATKVGMVFQDPENQLVAMDVEREIAFGLENLAFPPDVITKRIMTHPWDGSVYFRMSDVRTADPWDGRPKYQTGWGYGH